jgi:hypothetical protein
VTEAAEIVRVGVLRDTAITLYASVLFGSLSQSRRYHGDRIRRYDLARERRVCIL